jgi:hypothetical protein
LLPFQSARILCWAALLVARTDRRRLLPEVPVFIRWIFCITITSTLSGCGARPEAASPASEPSASTSDSAAERVIARLSAAPDGRLLIESPPTALLAGGWFVLHPARWPDDPAERPLVGVGYAYRDGGQLLAVPWGFRQTRDLREMEVVATSGPIPLTDSKLLVALERLDEDHVRILAGARDGAGSGDFYFIVDPDRASERVGEAVVAVVRIVETTETVSVGRIEHASETIAPHHLARFMQASLDRPDREASLVFAPLTSEQGLERLPAIASAVPGVLARYNISNIAIRTLDEPLDPRGTHAVRTAARAAPSDRFGTVFFGRVDDGTLLFHAAAFGEAPHPANTVGILTGGLPLAIVDSLEALSVQLAPSFLATALALRGDHAIAIYLLERSLHELDLDPNIAFHLREHLALRYLSLGLAPVAFALMNDDIDRARREGLVLPLLNALSIRSYLGSATGLVEQWEADSHDFLTHAEGVLPPAALFFEHLDHASAMAANGRREEARDQLLARLDQMEGDENASHRSALLARLASVLAAEDAAFAALLVAEALQLDEEEDVPLRISLRLLASRIYVLAGEAERARTTLGEVFELLTDSTSAATRASVFRAAASLLTELDRPDDAWQAQRQASIALVESAQYEEAGRSMVQLSFMLLERAQARQGADGLPLFLEARSNIHLASELMLRLGNSLEASRLLLYAGVTESRIAPGAQVDQLFEDATRHAWASADAQSLYEVYVARFDTARALGQWSAAEQWRTEALRWAEWAGEVPREDLFTAVTF